MKGSTKPRVKTHSIVVGNLSNTASCKIKATLLSPNNVANWDVATDPICLKQYLHQFALEVVEKLVVRNPQRYSSQFQQLRQIIY